MDFQIDLRVAELLASRLCHDLVGPIGAVCNGMELLEDDDFGMGDDAIKLAGNSARQAGATLQFYRLAYGMAGSRLGTDISSLRDLAVDYLATTKVTLDWPVTTVSEDAPDGLGKVLLNMIALAIEALPRGGELTVAMDAKSPAGASGMAGGGLTLSIIAAGTGALLRDETKTALASGVRIEDLTPRNVQGYFTKLLAARLGGELTFDSTVLDKLTFQATLPE